MDSKQEVKKANEELDLAMINLVKGMTEDLKNPKNNFEINYLKERVLVLETKIDMILKIVLK